MRKLVKKVLPISVLNVIKKILLFLKLIKNFYYDLYRYLRYSATFSPFSTKLRHQGRLIHAYHNIEKGLSLKSPRIGFGKQKVQDLINILVGYLKKYGPDRHSQAALNALVTYYEFNKLNGLNNLELKSRIDDIRNTYFTNKYLHHDPAILVLTKEQILKSININYEDFINSRHSIRNFSPGDIDEEILKRAIKLAQQTPSVCNRQTSKVHIYTNKGKIKEILKYQNGNKGFGEDIAVLMIVTVDLAFFNGINERYQGYIDGGMYSMSLINALHASGLGTCPLNCSNEVKNDIDLRRAAGIPNNENIIMMIGIGNIPDILKVARSTRRSVDEVAFFH